MPMSDAPLVLKAAPIVEAVVDIDCDLPPVAEADINAIEAVGLNAFGDRYPNPQRRMVSEHEVRLEPGRPPAVQLREGLQAFLYRSEDGKQIVQMRPNGFSFNRLAPYSTLDDYLPEIERTWRLFMGITHPVVCRVVRMRYINRIELPLTDGKVDLDKYLKVAPRSADDQRLTLTGFLGQQTLLEPATGSQANVVFATQQMTDARLPVIFDIAAFRVGDLEPGDWESISGRINQLRELKNLIFRNSLTPECLNLFQL